jgi:hypothetical protein
MGEQVRGEMGGETVGSTVRKVSKHWEKTSLLVDSTIANKQTHRIRCAPLSYSNLNIWFSLYCQEKKIVGIDGIDGMNG